MCHPHIQVGRTCLFYLCLHPHIYVFFKKHKILLSLTQLQIKIRRKYNPSSHLYAGWSCTAHPDHLRASFHCFLWGVDQFSSLLWGYLSTWGSSCNRRWRHKDEKKSLAQWCDSLERILRWSRSKSDGFHVNVESDTMATLWRNGGFKKIGYPEIPGRFPRWNDTWDQEGPGHNPVKVVAPQNPWLPPQSGLPFQKHPNWSGLSWTVPCLGLPSPAKKMQDYFNI